MSQFHVIVELDIDDEFTRLRSTAAQGTGIQHVRNHAVRRPLRGLLVKEDTFATISVISTSKGVPIANSSAPLQSDINYTSNFILQSVSEQRSEKFQPMSTFGATYGFFFGEQPRMMTFQAVLLNTADFQWEIEWWHNYENFLRGTKLVDNEARIWLTFDDQLIEGYLISASTGKSANNPSEVPLTFSMWVTNVEYLVDPGDPKVPNRGVAQTSFTAIDTPGLDFVSTTASVRKANLTALTGSTAPTGLLSKLRNAINEVGDFIDKTLTEMKNFLYGRNLVIPAGFAGSERNSGQAIFASGSGFEALIETALGTEGPTLSIHIPHFANAIVKSTAAVSTPSSVFYDNVDEYPVRASAIIAPPLVGTVLNVDTMYIGLAEKAFADQGFEILNAEGSHASDFMRTLGSATFMAVSVGASFALASDN